MQDIIVYAYAKINLGLEVLRKRPDGYHDIRSVFVAIDLADEVRFAPSEHLDVSCIPAMTARPEENLAYRAARSMLSHPSAAGKGAKIIVTKHIPAGGGLGGGSSDAAAVLLGLRRMYDLPISDAELHTMAASIGSDVPFFLHGGSALVEGRGEHITPVHLTLPYHVVLVLPGLHVETAGAYRGVTPRGEHPVRDLVKDVESIDLTCEHIQNDFERSVFAQHPVLQDIKHRLLAHGATYAAMSGSGSTMYGLFTSVDNVDLLRASFPGMDVYVCRVAPPPTPPALS